MAETTLPPKKKFAAVLGAIIGLVLFGGWLSWKSTHDEAVMQCVHRGVAYFKGVDMYPTLSDGRNAEQEARERCGRTTTAF